MDRGEPSDEPSDAELVEHARAGDRVAMASLVRRHRPMALAMCTGLLHRPEVAEDAVQEALLAAVLGIGRLRRPDRFGPWLCGIALNIARRWLRADGRAPVALDPDHVAVVDPTPGPERLVVASDTASRVRRAVAALPPGQRDALALYYLAERTGSEVADALAISPAATKTRLHKGRLALRRALDDQREVELVSSTIGMRVAEVRREPATAEPVRRYAIVLESDDGGHRFPIYVGEPEATAVALRLAGIELPRPLTHVLLTNTIAALGGRVTGVRVTRLAEQTFFGEIELEARDGPVSIDARPSDAINVALLAEVPIEVELAVLDEVATSPHARVDDALSEGTAQIAAEVEAAFAEARRRYAEPPPEDSATS